MLWKKSQHCPHPLNGTKSSKLSLQIRFLHIIAKSTDEECLIERELVRKLLDLR